MILRSSGPGTRLSRSTRRVTFNPRYHARDLYLTGKQLYHSIHAKGENVEDILRQAEAGESGQRNGPVEEEQPEEQEQQMETNDVEAPEIVPDEAGRDMPEVWTSFPCCTYF